MHANQESKPHHKFNVQSKLLTGLSKFGLNPDDWDLIPDSKNRILIQNKEQQTFRLRGQFRSEKRLLVWSEIELFSL